MVDDLFTQGTCETTRTFAVKVVVAEVMAHSLVVAWKAFAHTGLGNWSIKSAGQKFLVPVEEISATAHHKRVLASALQEDIAQMAWHFKELQTQCQVLEGAWLLNCVNTVHTNQSFKIAIVAIELINATTASTSLVSYKSTFVNVLFASDTVITDFANACELVLDVVNDAVSTVETKVCWTVWLNPTIWYAESQGVFEESAWRAWHTLVDINVSAHNVESNVSWVFERLHFAHTENFSGAWCSGCGQN